MLGRLASQAFGKHSIVTAAGKSGSLPVTRLRSRRGGRSPSLWLRWSAGLIGGIGLLAAFSPAQAQTAPAVPDASAAPEAELPVRPILQMGSQGESVRQLQSMLLLLGFYTGSVDGLYGASTAIAVADFQEEAGLAPDGIMGQATWNKLLPSLADLSTEAAPAESAPVSPADTAAAPPSSEATPADSEPAPPAPSPAPPEDATAPPAPEATPAPTPAAEAPTPTPAAETPDAADNPAEPEAADAADPVDLPILRLGMQGPAVERLQERLKALGFYTGAIDGIFGNATKTAVETAQRNYDIEPDGVVGPVTWAALLR